MLVLVASCGGGGPDGAAVDPALAPGTIAVSGTPAVGRPLAARAAPDLVGRIRSWGWHRCTRIPTCVTIAGADGPTYTPAAADAWQVLRVVAVAGGRGYEARVGPVVQPRPRPFEMEERLDPSRSGAIGTVVGPGTVRVRVDASCPVLLVGGVTTASVGDDHPQVDLPERTDRRIDESIATAGGELTVAVDGDCRQALVRISGSR